MTSPAARWRTRSSPARRLQGIARRALSVARGRRGTKAGDSGIPVRGLIPGMAVHLAECCNPLPGERIVGIVTTGKGVTIHTIDCDTLESFSDTPERWLDLAWEADADEKGVHVGRLNLVVANETGSLSKLTTAIARNNGNISKPQDHQPLARFLRDAGRYRGQGPRHSAISWPHCAA